MEFIKTIMAAFSEANEEFVKSVNTAWDDLKSDLKAVSQAQYLRLGAIFRRKKPDLSWQYGIFLGFDEILSTDEEGTVICNASFADFAEGEKLYVAANKHIALGGHEFIKRALLLKEEPPSNISSSDLVKICLEQADCTTVAEALRYAYGSLQWLEYVPRPKTEEDENEQCSPTTTAI